MIIFTHAIYHHNDERLLKLHISPSEQFVLYDYAQIIRKHNIVYGPDVGCIFIIVVKIFINIITWRQPRRH